VDRENKLAGIITRSDIVCALRLDPSGLTPALAAGKQTLITAFPDEPLSDAIARMIKNDVGRLPVVDRQHPGRIVGYLGRGSILAARFRHQKEEEFRERGPIMPFRFRN
jgi:CBS domain-containing protein